MTSYAANAGLFPLDSVAKVTKLFELELAKVESFGAAEAGCGANLALLSIVAGHLEHLWTASKSVPVTSTSTASEAEEEHETDRENYPVDPPLEWHIVDGLYSRFEAIIRGYCDAGLLSKALSEPANPDSVRPLIKHVADIVWNTLSKSHYKDRPHLQSIYSYLTGNKLDCFGVAFAVVAACQLLEVPQVHLALSEDHAWVVFGPEGTHTAEVTWHGKGSEDKRGQPVEILKAKTAWLYLGGQPVVCDRPMEVGALVSSINFAISSNLDSIECAQMQQQLLWLLYDKGHLQKYPMALGNLGDLEEISPTFGRPSCQKIFEVAITSNRNIYGNHHVYPFTYQAGYHYRAKEYKQALINWALAADVIKRYRYSKDDEEIYKEFMEIANELIPHAVKSAASAGNSKDNILSDPECFEAILRFYDGICCWEEGSATPVLHIGWAKHMVTTCSKFEAKVRDLVAIREGNGDDDLAGAATNNEIVNNNYYEKRKQANGNSTGERATTQRDCDSNEKSSLETIFSQETKQNNSLSIQTPADSDASSQISPASSTCSSASNISSSSSVLSSAPSAACDIANPSEISATVDTATSSHSKNETLIEKLTRGCGEKVLNVGYLLGLADSSPFLAPVQSEKVEDKRKVEDDLQYFSGLLERSRRSRKRRRRERKTRGKDTHLLRLPDTPTTDAKDDETKDGQTKGGQTKDDDKPASLTLKSNKMKGMSGLLKAEKLNTSAIQLQLTAQTSSDVVKGASEDTPTGRPKRSRRE